MRQRHLALPARCERRKPQRFRAAVIPGASLNNSLTRDASMSRMSAAVTSAPLDSVTEEPLEQVNSLGQPCHEIRRADLGILVRTSYRLELCSMRLKNRPAWERQHYQPTATCLTSGKAPQVSSHWVRSPLLNINSACQTCHNVPEEELRDKVHTIQDRTRALINRAALAMTRHARRNTACRSRGATPEKLAPIYALQRKSVWRLDFISSENSMGFHADQEAARILGESIDFSRQAQAAALRLRAPEAPESEREVAPIQGVTLTTGSPADDTNAANAASDDAKPAEAPPKSAPTGRD